MLGGDKKVLCKKYNITYDNNETCYKWSSDRNTPKNTNTKIKIWIFFINPNLLFIFCWKHGCTYLIQECIRALIHQMFIYPWSMISFYEIWYIIVIVSTITFPSNPRYIYIMIINQFILSLVLRNILKIVWTKETFFSVSFSKWRTTISTQSQIQFTVGFSVAMHACMWLYLFYFNRTIQITNHFRSEGKLLLREFIRCSCTLHVTIQGKLAFKIFFFQECIYILEKSDNFTLIVESWQVHSLKNEASRWRH